MAEPAVVMAKLDQQAAELDELSKALAATERKLEPLETQYIEALEDFEVACWDEHVSHEAKLPSAEMREKLARRTMPAQMLSERTALAKRRRIEKRIKALTEQIGAQRSILSALKSELEAAR